MPNYTVDTFHTLRDGSGRVIGKVAQDGNVWDGYHHKGTVDSNGRYRNENSGHEGWIDPGVSYSGTPGCGLALPVALAVAGFLSLKNLSPANRKNALIIAAVIMVLLCGCCGLLTVISLVASRGNI